MAALAAVCRRPVLNPGASSKVRGFGTVETGVKTGMVRTCIADWLRLGASAAGQTDEQKANRDKEQNLHSNLSKLLVKAQQKQEPCPEVLVRKAQEKIQ